MSVTVMSVTLFILGADRKCFCGCG